MHKLDVQRDQEHSKLNEGVSPRAREAPTQVRKI